MAAGGPEPLTDLSPRRLARIVLRQRWEDVTFLHWAVDPRQARPFLPSGVRPDTLDGRSYVGLVCFRLVGAAVAPGPAVPWLGTFLETNVRLYSVDGHGRRGVVFLSMDASRLAVVLGARVALGLPYAWAGMSLDRRWPLLTYTTRRRWPGPGTATSRVVVRVREALSSPTEVDRWLTNRWGLHAGGAYLPNEHDPWPLRGAELVDLDDRLVAAAGFPDLLERRPDSVLHSPGVRASFGRAGPYRGARP
jgi:uncharacterized protein